MGWGVCIDGGQGWAKVCLCFSEARGRGLLGVCGLVGVAETTVCCGFIKDTLENCFASVVLSVYIKRRLLSNIIVPLKEV